MIVESLDSFPRLFESFNLPNSENLNPYHQVIEEEEDYERQRHTINEEIGHCIEQLYDYINIWEPFKAIWEVDKDQFMEEFGDQDASAYDVNITIYSETANQVQLMESMSSVYFVNVHATQMKQSVHAHIEQWKEHFTNLLKKNAYEKISSKAIKRDIFLLFHFYFRHRNL